jgi:ubiquinone/menaquinone biosynthesis C-methylase UbiE
MHLLSLPFFYDLFQDAVGANAFREGFLTKFVETTESDSVLDLGCGTGVAAGHVNYQKFVGVDLSQKYIASARSRGLPRTEFVVGDCIEEIRRRPSASFDCVICGGLFHHLTDDQCEQLVIESARVLKPGGTLNCFEPVLDATTPMLTQRVMRMDRGKNLRSLSGWQELFGKAFKHVEIDIRRDCFRIPYDLVLVRAFKYDSAG